MGWRIRGLIWRKGKVFTSLLVGLTRDSTWYEVVCNDRRSFHTLWMGWVSGLGFLGKGKNQWDSPGIPFGMMWYAMKGEVFRSCEGGPVEILLCMMWRYAMKEKVFTSLWPDSTWADVVMWIMDGLEEGGIWRYHDESVYCSYKFYICPIGLFSFILWHGSDFRNRYLAYTLDKQETEMWVRTLTYRGPVSDRSITLITTALWPLFYSQM